MSQLYQINKLHHQDQNLLNELDLLSNELKMLKAHLKSEFSHMRHRKNKQIRGSMDLDIFYSLDFKTEKYKEKNELDKLMKEYNTVDKGYKKARANREISSRMDYIKARFDE